MKRLLLIIILFTISIFSQTMTDAEPEYTSGKQYAFFNFEFNELFGGTSKKTYYLLREDGSVMLREDGSKMLREDAP